MHRNQNWEEWHGVVAVTLGAEPGGKIPVPLKSQVQETQQKLIFVNLECVFLCLQG